MIAEGFAEDSDMPEDEDALQAEADKALLREVIDAQDSDRDEFAAFEDMLDDLNHHRIKRLSEKQRAWLCRAADRLMVTYDSRDWQRPIKAADVPRGREVATPAILRDLPKRPPGRGRNAHGDDRLVEPDPDPTTGAELAAFDGLERDWGDL